MTLLLLTLLLSLGGCVNKSSEIVSHDSVAYDGPMVLPDKSQEKPVEKIKPVIKKKKK